MKSPASNFLNYLFPSRRWPARIYRNELAKRQKVGAAGVIQETADRSILV